MLTNNAILSDVETNQILETRKLQATEGAGNIVTAASRPGFQYFPFDSDRYPHRGLLGSLMGTKWEPVLRANPIDLVPLDPYSASTLRPDGLQVWDAVVGIPGSAIRPDHTVLVNQLPVLRNTNRYWTNNLVPALGRVGNLGPTGQRIRPRDQYILDIMVHPLGWKIREAIHAMAHLTGDIKPTEYRPGVVYAGRTRFREQQMLAQIAVCIAYRLPFDTWCLDEGNKGEPDIVQYGIEIKSSSYFRTPALRVPCLSNEAPRPDSTVAIISVGVYIEPHPAAMGQGTNAWQEINRFACCPTMAVIAGWECVDVITHHTICANSLKGVNTVLCYGMTPNDLQGPDTFGALVAAGIESRGPPAVDNKRYWYVEDWLESAEFKCLLASTPPVPCLDCMRFNMKTEGAPKRPTGVPPGPMSTKSKKALATGKLVLTDEERAWREWDDTLKEASRLIETATIFYETTIAGNRAAVRRSRMSRKIRHRDKIKNMEQLRKIESAITRSIKAGKPSRTMALRNKRTELIMLLQSKEQKCLS